MRTKNAYENNLQSVEIDPKFSSLYGIKSNSCLHCLNFFHVTSGLPPDLAHDLFEGFAVDFISSIIEHCVGAQYFTLEELNDITLTFSYSFLDKSNKPQILKVFSANNFKVKLTACEMWNFLRLFPLMIGQSVPKTDKKWILFTDFLQILERLCAQEFEDAQLSVLENLLDTFFNNFSKNAPQETLKPKAHFLQHYPKMIKTFGPLVKTLRFEAKHAYFKTVFHGSKNRKNVCLTLSKRHQMMMYLNYIKSDLLKHDDPEGIALKEIPMESLDQPVHDVLKAKLEINDSDLLCQSKAVVYEGLRYNKGESVVIDFDNDEPLFGSINSVLYFRKGIYLLCELLIILRFDTHFNSYEVTTSGVLDLVNLTNSFDYHPLGIYDVHGKKLLPLIHSIDSNI